MTLYESIYLRQSIRNFRIEPVTDRLLNGLARFEQELVPLSPDIFVKFEVYDNLDGKAPVKGGPAPYSKVPYYLVCFSERKGDYLKNAGCLMEQMALYLHSKGCGTCFVGGARLDRSLKGDDACGFVMALAFGIPKGELNRKFKDARRMSLSTLCVQKEPMKAVTRQLLEAARMAPSSLNSQPWRFVVYEGRIHIFEKSSSVRTPFYRKWTDVNMGIMMAHLILAAEELWVDLVFKEMDNLSARSTANNNEYVTTAVVKA